ncbi:MAG: putative DNA-binding protein with PD1-like DNA-binding motif [Rhodobacteraceae bacterium HLUCCA12]|nr:MAG: putative DNA-binding protein with PD1-like DNA-binding motif [Rhodobacteraceae bacterium HLUCCA12]
MTTGLRHIRHPGAPADRRIRALPCQAVELRLDLRAGQSLSDAVPAAFARLGFTAGYLRLDGAEFAPLHFVTPAPAPGDGHAAWYSATHRIVAGARVRHAGAHLGRRDGQPFLHCHGMWHAADGASESGADTGHMLCGDSVLARDCTLTGWGIRGAEMTARHDPETDFTLFRPEPTAQGAQGDAFLITLRPNQDIGAALSDFARAQSLRAARIEGIGSLIGIAFDDGRSIDSYATEILIVNGQLQGEALSLEVGGTGFDGRSQSGRLAPGANAICVTAEVLLLPQR